MSNIMAVLLNGIAQLEYDRDRLLPDQQLAYLDKMDSKMDDGIRIGNEMVVNPGLEQRTQFAAANLLHALKSDDPPVAAAMCSYLAIRMPDLKQVLIEDNAGQVSIEFVFDREYKRQVVVNFNSTH